MNLYRILWFFFKMLNSNRWKEVWNDENVTVLAWVFSSCLYLPGWSSWVGFLAPGLHFTLSSVDAESQLTWLMWLCSITCFRAVVSSPPPWLLAPELAPTLTSWATGKATNGEKSYVSICVCAPEIKLENITPCLKTPSWLHIIVEASSIPRV